MSEWRLRVPPSQLRELAKDYHDPRDPAAIAAGQRAREAGAFDRDDFLAVCRWKSHRRLDLCEMNTTDAIVECTGIALSARTEQLRTAALLSLDGIGWPMASALLHLAHRDPYPVLDRRALWTWGIDKPPDDYTFSFWWEYVQECRRLANEMDLDMRNLDRALWQYSNEHQDKL